MAFTLSIKKRELLISGYVGSLERSFNLHSIIPSSILPIIYSYYHAFDIWDKQYTNIKIENDIWIKCATGSTVTAYGSFIIESGDCYVWTLKIHSNCSFTVGVIINEPHILRQNKYREDWWKRDGLGFVPEHGLCGYNANTISYGNYCNNSGDILEIKCDLRAKYGKISFAINGIDFGDTGYKLSTKKSYRLCFTNWASSGSMIELIT